VTSVAQGSTVTLISQWYEYAGGPAIDLVTGPTIRIIRLSDNEIIVAETTTGINHPSVGVYTYNWTPASDAELGNYLVVWEGTDEASETVTANEVVEVTVTAALAGTWATPAEATSITGQTITQAQLDVAYHVIEIYAGAVINSRANLTNRDLRLLKKAEAYQAAWMAAQIDLTGRSDADLVSQDGLQYSKGDQDMHILGPLAKRAIGKLSWCRTRTINPLTPTQALALRNKATAETIGLMDNEEEDDFGSGWMPL
jgi:hypothetical protein